MKIARSMKIARKRAKEHHVLVFERRGGVTKKRANKSSSGIFFYPTYEMWQRAYPWHIHAAADLRQAEVVGARSRTRTGTDPSGSSGF